MRFLQWILAGFSGNAKGRVLALSIGCTAAALNAPVLYGQSQSGFTYNGVVYTSYQANEYTQTPQGPQGAAAIRATGANHGAVMVTQYMQTSTSTTIAPETTSSPGYNPQANPLSPTDVAVTAAIHNLQAQGLIVVMKPQVDSLDGVFRGQFAPTDPSAWFASYSTFLLHYADIATQNNVGYLIIGTELKSLSGTAYVAYWTKLIATLRANYPNLTLIYGANATGAGDEFTTVSFWSLVDIIGVDVYVPLTSQTDPTLPQLVAAWTSNRYGFNMVAALKSLQAQYSKPLIFTEIGYVSAPGTNETPYANAPTGAAYDPTEQGNCYEAFFEVFSQQTAWMKGVFWWAWSVSSPGGSDTGYTPQNKPAAVTTLPKWFGSTTPGFTLASSHQKLSVTAGATASATIAITGQGGFSSPVSLSATGLPSGVTAAFTTGVGNGTQLLTLTAASSASSAQGTINIAGTSGTLLAGTGVTLTVVPLPAQTITFANPGTQAVGAPLTLSASSTSGLPVSFASATTSVCTVSGTTATFLSAGTCTLTASQAGNASYAPATSVQQTFTVQPAAGISLSATSSTITVQDGGSAMDAITVSSLGGFSGNVSLSAVLTSSPANAQYPPTLSFGSGSSVSVSSSSPGSATLTVSTTLTTAQASRPARWFAPSAGAEHIAFACLTLCVLPWRRRSGRRWLSAMKLVVCLVAACMTVTGCSGGKASSSGGTTTTAATTRGTYSVSVSATSGTLTSTLPLTITVQ